MDKKLKSDSALSALSEPKQSYGEAGYDQRIKFYILRGNAPDTPEKISFRVFDPNLQSEIDLQPIRLECLYTKKRKLVYLWVYSADSSTDINELKLSLFDKQESQKFLILNELKVNGIHNFLFDLDIKDEKTWIIFNKTKPGKEIKNPIDMLAFLSYFILDSDDPLAILHDFVPSFTSYYKTAKEIKTYKKKSKDNILRLFESLNLKLQNEASKIDFKMKSLIVLVIIGMLQSFYTKNIGKEIDASRLMFHALAENFDSYIEHLQDENTKNHALSGLINLMAFNLNLKKGDSLAPLYSIDQPIYVERLIFGILDVMSVSFQQYKFLAEEIDIIKAKLLSYSDMKDPMQILKSFAKHLYDIQDFLEIIHWSFVLLTRPNGGERNEFSIISDSDKVEMQSELDKFIEKIKPNLSNLACILRFNSDKATSFKSLINTHRLRVYINKSVFIYDELEYAIRTYQSILNDYYDPEYRIDAKSIAFDLLYKDVDIFTIKNIFNFTRENLQDILEAWLKNLMVRIPEDAFKIMEDQLSRFDPCDFLSNACSMFILKLYEYATNRRQDLLDYIHLFYYCKVPQLQDEYISAVISGIILPVSTEPQTYKDRLMNRLMDLVRGEELNSISKALLSAASGSLMDLNNIKQRDIFMNICENPSSNFSWYAIMNQYTRYVETFRLDKILDYIDQLIQNISSKTIRFEEIMAIDSHNDNQRSSFFAYINKFYEIKGVIPNMPFQESLKSALEALRSKLNSIEVFRMFIDRLCRDMDGLELIEEKFQSAIHNFESMKLKEFDLSRNLGLLYDISKSFYPFIDSIIFENSFKSNKSRGNFNLNSLPSVFNSTHESIFKMIGRLDQSTVNIRSSRLRLLNLDIKKIPRELEIFDNIFQLQLEKREKFRTLLYYYNLRLRMKTYCDSVIKLAKLIHIEDEILASCKRYNEFIEKSKQALDDFMLISGQVFQMLNIEIPMDEEHIRVFNFLQEYISKSDLIEFLSKITQEELEYLKDGVNDYDESTLTTRTMLDLENLWSLQNEIRKLNGFTHLFNLIAIKLRANIYKDLIPSCYSKFEEIRELHIELNCKENAKKNQIHEIYNSSRFIFKLGKDEMYDIELIMNKNNKVDICLSTLNELKARASLILYTSESMEKADDQNEIYKKFIEFVTSVSSIITCLNDLYSTGYLLDDIMKPFYTLIRGEIETVKRLDAHLMSISKQWEEDLKVVYHKYYWLTYLHGRQFWILENYLSTKEALTYQPIYLLNFMGKDLETRYPRLVINPNDSIKDRLENIGMYLNGLPNKLYHNLPLEVSTDQRIAQKADEILYLETSKLINGIISLYLNSGRKFPRADQLFFCKLTTEFQELIAFLNRCFINPEGELYLLISCENLTLDIQQKFIKLFYQLYQSELGRKNFQFGLITANGNDPIAKYFKYNQVLNAIRIRDSQIVSDNEVSRIVKTLDRSTQVVTSETTGLGKSHLIHHQTEYVNLPLVSVTIAGNINCKEIYTKLSSIEVIESSVLYFNLKYADDIELLNEILMNLSLFRCYYTSYGVICIPRNCYIHIEVANTYLNSLFNSLTYLKHLNRQHLLEMSMDRLLVNLNVYDPIQFVSTYLSQYESNTIDKTQIDYDTGFNMQIHDDYRIQELYYKYFISPQRLKNQPASYTQLKIFTRIMNYLLRNFSQSYFFSLNNINTMIRNIKHSGLRFLIKEFETLRSTIFEALLITTDEFTTKSINNVRKMQSASISALQSDNPDLEEGSLISDFQCNFSWESSNHFIMIFLEDGSLMPIYKSCNLVPDNIKELIFLQNNANTDPRQLAHAVRNDLYQIEDISNLNHIQLLRKLQTFCVHVVLEKEYAEGEYVVTPDNFLKMNLIYLRVMSGIPVILMGDTGCGKTFLVRFFATKVLNHILEIMNIHAGVGSNVIREKINELRLKARDIPKGKKLWVFFDEFNTSDCMGLISEIMCEHSLDGEKLPENMAFLGACNRYRLKLKKLSFDENVGIKKTYRSNNSHKLMHIVKPLPDSMIEYVWDFGALQENDARKYIESMLRGIDSEYSELFVRIIISAHRYFTEKEDFSSVSLRDVKRFLILYEWFKTSIEVKERLEKDARYLTNAANYLFDVSSKLENSDLRAGILAACHCYLLRISADSERNGFLARICDEVGDERLKVNLINSVIAYEQYDYIIRMEIPQGTALNKALRENIFSVIPCVVNKIPIFVCGKPGSSKSLAIQLIFTNLRGEKSADSYFKTLPELSMFSFQGSDSCTSDGIIKVFDRAIKSLEAMKYANKNVLPVVIFDEIGLAEISKHNPLKVLHSLLEIENRTVGFVGISNWRLDASKMNRAIYLARPDPDDSDLKDTAMSISLSISGGSDKCESIILNLASSYFELKRRYKDTKYRDFYGLRDFYNLIKQVSGSLIELDRSSRYEEAVMIKRAIESNFGGLVGASKMMGEIFCKLHKLQDIWPNIPKPNVLELINYNLQDKNARYLMLITKGELGPFIIDKCLNIPIFNRRMLVGSNLEKDLNQEEYGFRSLSDVILYAEKGISVIFKDMNHIYSSLYDLFNQNFSVFGDRRYCRIALGAFFNPKCFIHEDFHAIVLMNDHDNSIAKADAPFLNRFEKHCFTLKDVLNETQKSALDRLYSWIDLIMSPSDPDLSILVKSNNIFPIYSEESLALLVLYNCRDIENEDYILERCKDLLLQSASADILILTLISKLNNEEAYTLRERWRHIHRIEFIDLMNSLIREVPVNDHNKVFVYTYHKNIFTNIFDSDHDNKIAHNNFSSFKSEHELRKDMISFFNSTSHYIYLLELDYNREGAHLTILKFLIDKLESETRNSWKFLKSIVIVVHMSRNIIYEPIQNMFEGWDYWMFNELFHSKLSLDENFLLKPTTKLIIEEELGSIEHFIKTYIEKCMMRFRYEPTIYNQDKRSLNEYILSVIENISKDERFQSQIKRKMIKSLNEGAARMKDWKRQIFSDPEIILNSTDLYTSILASINRELESLYTVILFLLENNCALNSYFTNYDQPCGILIRDIWSSCFENLTIHKIRLQIMNQSNLSKFGVEFTFPFIIYDFNNLSSIFNQYTQDASNEKFIGDPEEAFIYSFREKTILRDMILPFKEAKYLQELYFRNIIKLQISENLLELKYEDLYYSLLLRLCDIGIEFENKLLILLKYEKLFCITISLIDSYRPLCNTDIVHDLMDKFTSSTLDFGMAEEGPDWRNELSDIYQGIISSILPRFYILEQAGGIEVYISIIDKMYNLLLSLKYEQDIPINNIETISFWFQLCTLICEINPSNNFLETLLDFEYPYRVNDQLILDSTFANYIITTLKSIDGYETNSHILKFTSVYLSLLISNNQDWLMNIAEYMEDTEIWRYSSQLIDNIIDKTGLSEHITQLQISLSFEGEDIQDLSDENEYILRLEDVLNKYGIDCKLAILLSDRLMKYFDYNGESYDDLDSQMKEHLILSKTLFDYLTNLTLYENNSIKSIKKLVKMIILRKSYDIYSYVVSHDLELNELQVQILDEYSIYIEEGPFSELLKLYCIKKIKQLHNFTTEETLKYLSSRDRTNWIQECTATQENYELKIFPIIPQLFDKYSIFTLSLKKVLMSDTNSDIIDRTIIESRTPEDRLVIGLGFQNIIFSRYLDEAQINPNISRWYQNKEHLLLEYLGKELASLISHFIFNFPSNSILRLGPDSARYHTQINTLCFALNIVFSYNKIPSSMTSIFFDSEGNVQPGFIQRFNSRFIFAAESSPILDDLKLKLENFDSLKTTNFMPAYAKGGCYKCSNTCDYLYFIGQCGGAMVVGKCPFCKSDIGGTNHQIVQRPGHENLTDDEALEFLRNRIRKHEQNSESGYKQLGEDTPYVRNLKTITFKFLRFILNTVLYYLKISNLVSQEDMKQIFSVPSDNYERSLRNIINMDLESLHEKLDNEESFIWNYHIISLLPEFISNSKILPNSLEGRNSFEKEFEARIINPSLESVSNIIISYKQIFMNAEARKLFYIGAIEEIHLPESEEYSLIKLFRLLRDSSFDNMINVFNMSSLKDNYPILDIYLKNYQDFNKLKSLYPIIELTNYLMREYNHTITRQYARETPMNHLTSNNLELRRLYGAFLEAWNNAELYDLQYGCKQLNSIQFYEDSSLIYFLVDDKEEGGGMYMAAALQNLAALHNRLLESLAKSLAIMRKLKEKHIIDQQIYGIQSIKGSNILSRMQNELSLIEVCSLNDCVYGRGKEVIYDFDRLQNNLIKHFLNSKFLDQNNLDLIQYQFEFLNTNSNQSGIISVIRNMIPQKELDKGMTTKLEEFMRDIERQERGSFYLALNEIYSSMSNVLCYLKTAGRNPEETLCSFSNQIRSSRLSPYLTEENRISNISLMYVVALYEFIEERYFPNILKYVKSEFTNKERKEDIEIKVEQLLDRCRNSDQLPNVEMIKNAVIRFISRLLTADLDPNLPMKMYLKNRDFWNVSVTDQVLENLEPILSEDTRLADSILFYETFIKCMKPEPKKKAQDIIRQAPVRRRPDFKDMKKLIR
jgi:hypothetical protein